MKSKVDDQQIVGLHLQHLLNCSFLWCGVVLNFCIAFRLHAVLRYGAINQ